MNEEYLSQFDDKQLEHYEGLMKRRIKGKV